MHISRTRLASGLALVLCLMLALGACAPAPTPTTAPPAPPTSAPAPTTAPATSTGQATALKLSQTTALGQFLGDGNGRTLYIYARDSKDTPTCYDDCAKNWPAFTTQGKSAALDGVNAAMIGTAQRKEGTTQVTYNGWPLYYWNADVKAGDTFGQGIGNVWWVIQSTGDTVTA